jgi:hypothetical protein
MSLLVLTASGDDFNLLRAALPSAAVGIPLGTFLEDDENSDFLGPEQDPTPRANSRKAPDTTAVARPGPGSGCSTLDRCHPPGAAPSSIISRTPHWTPLRC